ncbi:MAG: extracellular solute-binding protein [Verrucomicrobia bacterium]|nr:extracellular solute-binding protein [Verrucomicrobiota bacterium]
MKSKFRTHVFRVWMLVALLLSLGAWVAARAGEVLYADDFTNLDPTWGTPGDIIRVQDGKLVLKPAPNTSQNILNQSQVFEDAEITLDVTITDGATEVPGGLIFWAKDYSNFYCLCVNANGRFKISRYVTDRWLNPINWTETNALNKGLGQVNRLRLVTTSHQAIIYINDTSILTFNGQPPRGGGCIGISGTSAEGSPTVWQFANLRVIAASPGGPVAAPAGPAVPTPAALAAASPSQAPPVPTASPAASVAPSPAATVAAAAATPAAPAVPSPSPAAVNAATPTEAAPGPAPAATPVVAASPAVAATPGPAGGRRVALRLHGSNTIGAELAPAIAEEFLKHEGAISVQRKPGLREDETNLDAVLPDESAESVVIEIQGHGSKAAFDDLAADACDIGMSSRRIKAEEAQRCARAGLGDLVSAGGEHLLGLDAIVILVHKSNPIGALNKEQLADIFSGKITDWSQVGGRPGGINLYAMGDRSGTFDTFKALVLGSRNLSPRALRYESNAKLSDDVATDNNGIGFAGMGFVRGARAVALGEPGAAPVMATPFSIVSQEYPLSRQLLLYSAVEPKNPWVRKFLDFARPKLEVFSWWTSGGEAAALDALVRTYQTAYPGVAVINATVAGGGGSAARPVLQTRLAVNNPPDTWQTHPGWELLGQYVTPGYCDSLSELFRSEGWDKAFPKALVDLVTKNGQPYAVPVGIHRGNVLWYNKKLLAQQGITIGPKLSFDEFFADCEKLKAAGVPALGVGDAGIWASAQLFENTLLGVVGPQGWSDLFSGRRRWDDPAVKQAVEYFGRMQDYFNNDHAALTWDQAIKRLMDGKVGFSCMGDWADGEFIKARLQENVDFGWVSFPGTDGDFMLVSDSFTLAKGAPHKESAIAWLKSIGSKDAQRTFSAQKGSIPARTDVERAGFDLYHQWSMTDFAEDKLLPSCVHGSAAPASFQQAFNDAVAAYMADRNTDNFTGALVQAAQKMSPEAVERVDLGGRKIELMDSPPLPPDAPPDYARQVQGAGKLNVTFRFSAGSRRLDEKSRRDLERMVEILRNPQYQRRQLLLFGFSDNKGSARWNVALSKDRAKEVAELFRKHGISPALVTGYGMALPVAPNDSDQGRQENRRVEAWLR